MIQVNEHATQALTSKSDSDIQTFIDRGKHTCSSHTLMVLYKVKGCWFQHSHKEKLQIQPTYSGFNHHLKQIQSLPLNTTKKWRTVPSLKKYFDSPGYTIGIPFSKPHLTKAWLLIHSHQGKAPSTKKTKQHIYNFEKLCENCLAENITELTTRLETKEHQDLTLVTFAHQLKSPLNVMETYLAPDPLIKNEQFTKGVLHKVRSTQKFIKDFLVFSKEKRKSFHPIHMDKLLEEVRRFYCYDPTVKDVKLLISNLELAPNLVLKGNQTLLFQVFQNLIENAVRAMQGKGTIEIKSFSGFKDKHPLINITVSDTGPGIPPEAIEYSFKPFHSSSGSYGLGLSLCRDILQLHGGELHYYSPKKGSPGYFEMLLPLNKKSFHEK